MSNISNKTLDTCDHCGAKYDPNNQGHEHYEYCECYYCDEEHPDFDKINSIAIKEYVLKHGRLCFCCQECEVNFLHDTIKFL